MPSASSPFTVAALRPPDVHYDDGYWWLELDSRTVRLSNLDKLFWPATGATKGDLIAYYHTVAERILPYLAGRPLTLRRMPDGADGGHFFEKDAPRHTPPWMPRCRVLDFEGEGANDFLVVEDLAGLLFVANLGCIEFHPLHSRCRTVHHPDYVLFDLDPFEPATFGDVVAVARHVRTALDSLGLTGYPKTSGATGMHVYVPVAAGADFGQVRTLAEVIGRSILAADPGRVTMEWQVSKRAGKVFIDHNMNRRGANMVAAYSLRPTPAGTVSMPLTWSQVEEGLDPGDFTIESVPSLVHSGEGDPFRGVIDAPVDLTASLDRLGLPRLPDGPGDPEPLAAYLAKRDLSRTPEPGPGGSDGHGDRFVIQKHDARRLHYDLRLERDGVLVSWALPKGLPSASGERRRAIHTEDHPLDYASFEGVIPDGEYGAGEVRIYDRGTYRSSRWDDDRITFTLEGDRHRGTFHLVRTGDDWLAVGGRDVAQPEPPLLAPMLPDAGDHAFDDPGWRFEPLLRGERLLAYVTPKETTLIAADGRDVGDEHPALSDLAKEVNAASAVIDAVAVPSDDAEHVYVLDLLWLDGADRTGDPLQERIEALGDVTTESERVRFPYASVGNGTEMLHAASGLGLEGIVAKRLGSIYRPGTRSSDWLRIDA